MFHRLPILRGCLPTWGLPPPRGAPIQTEVCLFYPRSTYWLLLLLLNLSPLSITSTNGRLPIAEKLEAKKNTTPKPAWLARLHPRTDQSHLSLYPPHTSLSWPGRGVSSASHSAGSRTHGNRTSTRLSFFWVFSRQEPIGHPCLGLLPVRPLPSQTAAHGGDGRGSRPRAAGHAPLDAFPKDAPPFSSLAVQFPPLPEATCEAFPRGTIPPLLYIIHFVAL